MHSACWQWPAQMGGALNVWMEILTRTWKCFSNMTSNQEIVGPVWSVSVFDTRFLGWRGRYFYSSIHFGTSHSFTRIYFNHLSNVQTKPAIILTMACALVRIEFSWLFLYHEQLTKSLSQRINCCFSTSKLYFFTHHQRVGVWRAANLSVAKSPLRWLSL